MSLSPEQFFHGSTHDITDAVKPGSEVGKANYDYDEDSGLVRGSYNPNEHVHGVPNEADAWEFAGYKGRRRVYSLDPKATTDGKEDPNWSDDSTVWPHAVPVTGRIDIIHPRVYGVNRVHGVQGTLPPVDWNQYAPSNPGDANFHALYTEGVRRAQGDLNALLQSKKRQAREPAARQEVPGQMSLF